LLVRGRLGVGVQKFGYLPAGELQLWEEKRALGFGCLHSRTECLHGIPGVVDIEDGVVVILEVVAMNWDVAGADEASTTISKLCFVLVNFHGELSVKSEEHSLVKFSIARKRLAAILNIIFVVGGSVFTERSTIKTIFDHLSG
jgi:hypothetical protein